MFRVSFSIFDLKGENLRVHVFGNNKSYASSAHHQKVEATNKNVNTPEIKTGFFDSQYRKGLVVWAHMAMGMISVNEYRRLV